MTWRFADLAVALVVGVVLANNSTFVSADRIPNECMVNGKAVGQCMQVDLNTMEVVDDHYQNVRGGGCKDQFNNDKSLISPTIGGAENCPAASNPLDERCCICPGVCEDTTKYGCVRPDCQGPDCYLKNACPGGDNHRCCVSGITCALGPNGQCTPPDTTTKTTKTTKTTPSPSPPSPGVTTTTTKAGPTTTKKPRTPSPPATAPPPAPLACGGGGKVKVIGPPDDLMFLKAAHIGNFELDTMSIDAHATCKSPFHINEDKVRVGGELTGCPGYKSENKLDLEMKPGKKDERYLYLWLHTITGHGGDGDHNLHEGHYVITWGPPEDSPQSRHDAPYVATYGVFAESAYTDTTRVTDTKDWNAPGETDGHPGFRIACESEETDDDDVVLGWTTKTTTLGPMISPPPTPPATPRPTYTAAPTSSIPTTTTGPSCNTCFSGTGMCNLRAAGKVFCKNPDSGKICADISGGSWEPCFQVDDDDDIFNGPTAPRTTKTTTTKTTFDWKATTKTPGQDTTYKGGRTTSTTTKATTRKVDRTTVTVTTTTPDPLYIIADDCDSRPGYRTILTYAECKKWTSQLGYRDPLDLPKLKAAKGCFFAQSGNSKDYVTYFVSKDWPNAVSTPGRQYICVQGGTTTTPVTTTLGKGLGGGTTVASTDTTTQQVIVGPTVSTTLTTATTSTTTTIPSNCIKPAVARYVQGKVGCYCLASVCIEGGDGCKTERSVFFGVPDSSYWFDDECPLCKCKATTTTTTTATATTYTGTTETTSTTTTTTVTATTADKEKIAGAPTTKYEAAVLTTTSTTNATFIPTTDVKSFCVACLVVGLLFLLLLLLMCCWCVQKRRKEALAAAAAGVVAGPSTVAMMDNPMYTHLAGSPAGAHGLVANDTYGAGGVVAGAHGLVANDTYGVGGIVPAAGGHGLVSNATYATPAEGSHGILNNAVYGGAAGAAGLRAMSIATNGGIIMAPGQKRSGGAQVNAAYDVSSGQKRSGGAQVNAAYDVSSRRGGASGDIIPPALYVEGPGSSGTLVPEALYVDGGILDHQGNAIDGGANPAYFLSAGSSGGGNAGRGAGGPGSASAANSALYAIPFESTPSPAVYATAVAAPLYSNKLRRPEPTMYATAVHVSRPAANYASPFRDERSQSVVSASEYHNMIPSGSGTATMHIGGSGVYSSTNASAGKYATVPTALRPGGAQPNASYRVQQPAARGGAVANTVYGGTDAASPPIVRTASRQGSSAAATGQRPRVLTLSTDADAATGSGFSSTDPVVAEFLQTPLTGSEAEKALRHANAGPGSYCLRPSLKESGVLVLVIEGPSRALRHFKFKKDGRGKISLMGQSKQKVTFNTVDEVLRHYAATSPKTSGLHAAPIRCIPYPGSEA